MKPYIKSDFVGEYGELGTAAKVPPAGGGSADVTAAAVAAAISGMTGTQKDAVVQALGIVNDAYEIVDAIPEDADHGKKYVLPDGYVYEWVEGKEIEHQHNANTGIINMAPNTNANKDSMSEKPGVLTSGLIPWDSSWTEWNKEPTKITISGPGPLVPAYNASVIVWYYKQDGSYKTAMLQSQMHSMGTPSATAQIDLPVTFNLADLNLYPINDIGYVRVMVGISTQGAITASDVADIVINVPFYDSTELFTGWYNTGEKYVPGTSEVIYRVASLEEEVNWLLEKEVSRSTNQRLFVVGDSIAYGYGIGGNANAWPAKVVALNGYDESNSHNLSQSGLGFCTTSSSGYTLRDIIDATSFSTADIVVVALGINDWKSSSATLADFFDAMDYAFGKIRADNPWCKLYYLLPINARFLGTYQSFYCLGSKGEADPELCYGNTLKHFVSLIADKIKTDFSAYDISIIDLVESPAVNRNNIQTALIDYTHPSAVAQAEIGREIAQKIL